ncbi:hypothetical protein J6590_100215 [Homalodisca vitripennis]|nr:hypothetical protein J6590_100215 [Homalodisca vitripennis]
MVVADADKIVLVIDVGTREKQINGGVFIATALFQRLENKEFIVPPDKPHEAFPPKKSCVFFLLLIFPYNNKITIVAYSSARKTIESAFGILHVKWRLLRTSLEIPSIASMQYNIIKGRDVADYYDISCRYVKTLFKNVEHGVHLIPEVFKTPNKEAKREKHLTTLDGGGRGSRSGVTMSLTPVVASVLCIHNTNIKLSVNTQPFYRSSPAAYCSCSGCGLMSGLFKPGTTLVSNEPP